MQRIKFALFSTSLTCLRCELRNIVILSCPAIFCKQRYLKVKPRTKNTNNHDTNTLTADRERVRQAPAPHLEQVPAVGQEQHSHRG